MTEGIRAAAPNAIVANAEIFSPFGSAGILAIYPTPGQILRYVFLVRVFRIAIRRKLIWNRTSLL